MNDKYETNHGAVTTNSGTDNFYMDADYNTGYKCSRCGGNVNLVTLTSFPGADKYTCLKCGSTKTIEHKISEPIIIDM